MSLPASLLNSSLFSVFNCLFDRCFLFCDWCVSELGQWCFVRTFGKVVSRLVCYDCFASVCCVCSLAWFGGSVLSVVCGCLM